MWQLKAWSSNHSYVAVKAFSAPLEKDLGPGCRDFLPFSNDSISVAGHWCWAIRPGSQSALEFISKGVERGWGPRSVPTRFFSSKLRKPFLYRPHWVQGDTVMLKQERVKWTWVSNYFVIYFTSCFLFVLTRNRVTAADKYLSINKLCIINTLHP